MTEFELPDGWLTQVTVDCFEQVSTNNSSVKTKDCMTTGQFPVIDQGQAFIAGYTDDSSKVVKLDSPIVVFGDHTRVVKWVDFDFVPGADGTKLLKPQNYLYPRFFYHQFKSLEIPDKGYARHFKHLRELQFLVPPLAEQKAIADKLDTLLAQVDNTKARLERIPEILKSFRQSVLAAAVSGKLTDGWRNLNTTEPVRNLVEEQTALKKGLLKVRGSNTWNSESELIALPANWTWIENYKLAVDQSNAICAGPFGTIFKAKDFRDDGVPIIFLRHVKETGFNQEKPTYMDIDVWKELHQEYSVYGGELLVTKLGDPPGECCVYPTDIGVSMVTPDVLKMTVDEEIANKAYLRFFFNSPLSKKMVEDAAFGATRLRIDMALFKLFPVPLAPMEEQTEIVRRVDQLFAFADSIEQKANAALARVNNLTQSILAKAFRGELTADWRAANPDLISGDNCAEALLAKIKAERAKVKTRTKG